MVSSIKAYKRLRQGKMKIFSFRLTIFALLLLAATCIHVEAKGCKPSGKIKGKNPPKDKCNRKNDSDCCVEGESYTTYKCSPRVTRHTKAVLTLNSFEKRVDGGGPSECDKKFHSDDLKIVALSTGWFHKKKRCFHNFTMRGNGLSVVAMVVDECDSTMGCDDEHDYQPPCANIVDASKGRLESSRRAEEIQGRIEYYLV